jgi:hypothetical protein
LKTFFFFETLNAFFADDVIGMIDLNYLFDLNKVFWRHQITA